jgi:hypothetical protein
MARSVVTRAFVTLRSRNLVENGYRSRHILVLCCFRLEAAQGKNAGLRCTDAYRKE